MPHFGGTAAGMGIGRMLAMRQPAVVLTSVWLIRKSASGAGCPGAEGEAGIFYCRRPGQPQGRIISITPKYFPYVTGDGWRTLRQLILGDARAGRLSHLYLRRHTARLDEVPAPGEAIRLAFAGSHSRGAPRRPGCGAALQPGSRCL
jgi:hypothetical protein